MKKLIAFAAILSVGSLFAGDSVTNFYGLLQVNSSDSRTIVAIPWIDASTTNGEIKVADVVRTAELSPDDTIHYYNGTEYESWKLNDETQWVAAVQSGSSFVEGQGTAADAKALKRGNALMLMRTNAENRKDSFYLWGQVASSTPTNELTRSSEKMVSSLIAPPMATDVNINNQGQVTWDHVSAGDRIYIDTPTNRVECQLVGDTWKSYCVTSITELGKLKIKVEHYGWIAPSPIAAGTGFWYVTTNGNETTKVIWNGAPKVAAKVN